jgi:hypothetical protein
MENRTYAKQELAQLYFPGHNPHAAVQNFNYMITHCKPLKEALRGTHAPRFAKMFTPRQVQLITEYLGEP